MAARPWTDADTARLREMHAQGATLTAIAKDLGRSKDTISKKAAAAGLGFDRSRTETATQAKKADAAERWAQAEDDALTLLRLRQQRLLETERDGKPWQTKLRSGGGAEETKSLPFIPSSDWRDEQSAFNTAEAAAGRIAARNAQKGVDDAKSMLRRLGDAIGVH